MDQKITQVTEATVKNPGLKWVPIPKNRYIVNPNHIPPKDEDRPLDKQEIREYMGIVGSLLWISGIRPDIMFAVIFLTWFTSCPQLHHLRSAYHVIQYLHTTMKIGLILGGPEGVNIQGLYDSALGTGKHGRTIVGYLFRLATEAGAIYSCTKSTQSTVLNIFEGELESGAKCLQTAKALQNIFKELGIKVDTPTLYGDNQASIEFIKGNNQPTGVRHMQLRLWMIRENYISNAVIFQHVPGATLLADYLTKLAYAVQHNIFAVSILGLRLIGITDIRNFLGHGCTEKYSEDDLEEEERANSV